MKKILLFALAIPVLSSSIHAQIKKGSILLGGDISFSSSKIESQQTTSQRGFSLSPLLGVAIKENLIVGGFAGISLTKNESFATPGAFGKNNNYSGGAFVRKYKQIGSNGFHFFLHGEAAYRNSKLVNNSGNSGIIAETTTSSISIGVKPGIAFAISNKFHLETGFNNLLSAGYSWSKANDPSNNDYKSRGFNFNSNLSDAGSLLYVGFRVLFNK